MGVKGINRGGRFQMKKFFFFKSKGSYTYHSQQNWTVIVHVHELTERQEISLTSPVTTIKEYLKYSNLRWSIWGNFSWMEITSIHRYHQSKYTTPWGLERKRKVQLFTQRSKKYMKFSLLTDKISKNFETLAKATLNTVLPEEMNKTHSKIHALTVCSRNNYNVNKLTVLWKMITTVI